MFMIMLVYMGVSLTSISGCAYMYIYSMYMYIYICTVKPYDSIIWSRIELVTQGTRIMSHFLS